VGQPDRPRADLIEQAVCAHFELLRAMTASSTEDWLQVDLTLAQIKALFALWQEAPLTIGALGDRLGVGVPTASHLVERLVQLGLVERREDESDRRRTHVSPSETGTALVERLRAVRGEQLRRRLDRLEDGDLAALVRGFDALVRAGTTRSGG
jgi:DNA-binding MarR family transcriptional regulator